METVTCMEKFAAALVGRAYPGPSQHTIVQLFACRLQDNNPSKETLVSNTFEKWHEPLLDLLLLAIKHLHLQSKPVIANRKVQSAAGPDHCGAKVQTPVRITSLQLQDGETREVQDKPAWTVSVAIQVLLPAGEAVRGKQFAQRAQRPQLEVQILPLMYDYLVSFTDPCV
jgi:hypothetical protein